MLKNYSSLAPRTASVERFDSTFRSQNELPENQPAGSTAWAGHAGPPRARLLMPQFGESASDTSTPSELINATNSTTQAIQPAPEQSGGHSLGITANQIRQRMNERSASTNAIDLLPEKQEQWQILSNNNSTPVASSSTTAATNDIDTPGAEDNATSPADTLFDSSTEATSISDSSPAVERSVLNRLKGLYGDSENNAKQLFKRNLQRLPNPWNVFREKEESPDAEPVDSVLPPFTTEPATEEPEAPIAQDNPVVVELIAAVESELQNWPRRLNGQVENPEGYQRRQQDLRLLHLIAGHPEEAIASIEGMPGPEQEFWQELMLGLAHFRSNDHPNREQRLTVTATQLRSAIGHIATQASLRFRRLEICSRINSFGRIEVFPSNEFDPGQPLLLYVELENFGTELTSRGTQRTNFDAQLQFLHHDSDDPIETIELSDIYDEATSERTDYFQSFELNIPSHLAPGLYRIRLQVRDAVRRKQTAGFVEFQVREPTSGT